MSLVERLARGGRVFVMGPYVPHGGTYMAYHLARILHVDSGAEVLAVTAGTETPEGGVFDYDPVFESVSLEEMLKAITIKDVLVANPSFSKHHLGLRVPAFKLMYVQGVNNLNFLDCNFDHYVAVSGFVQTVLSTIYGFRANVIPPFLGPLPQGEPPDWSARPPRSIVVSMKGDMALQTLILERLKRLMAERAPGIGLEAVLRPGRRNDFLAQISPARHLLTLSVVEGFGLVPLEAMALGTTVVGFDGYGGREYMSPGANCEVVRYPDFGGLADRLAVVLEDPEYAQSLANAGRLTAGSYGYERFRSAWRAELERAGTGQSA